MLGISVFTTVSVLGGHDTNTHLFLFLVIFVAFSIYPPRERVVMYGLILLALASFLGLKIWFVNHDGFLRLSPRFVKAMTLNFNVGLVVYVSGFSFYIYKIYFRVEEIIEAERKRAEQLLHNVLPQKSR